MAVDLAAWRVVETLEAERAENEARAMKDLPPLPSVFSRQRRSMPDTITINVRGEKRQVPPPPAGAFYGPDGQLIRPEGMTRRF